MIPSRALIPLSSDVNVRDSDGLPRYSQTKDSTPTRSGEEIRAEFLPPSTQSTFQPTSPLDRLTSPPRTAPAQQGIGHDTPPPNSSAYSDIHPAMSHSSAPHPTPQTLPSKKTSYNLEAIFNAASKSYEKRTKRDLISHPLTAQLQACDSPSAILAILRSQAAQFGSSPGGDRELTMWLVQVVNVLYDFSAVLGEGGTPVNVNPYVRASRSDVDSAESPPSQVGFRWYWYPLLGRWPR